MAHFQGLFFWKNEFFWKSSILKRFIFVVLEYGNLTSVKTHRDGLENSGGGHSGTRSSNFGFGKGKRPYRGFRCYSVIALSFFCLFYPWVFKNFLISALDCPFRVFTLESFFLSILVLFHFSFFFDCPIMHLTIQNSSRTSERF